MKFKEHLNHTSELSESKKIKFSTVQPNAGKPAVNDDGVNIDNSVVLGKGLIAVGGSFGPGDQIEIFDARSGKMSVALPNDVVKNLKRLK